VLHVHPKKLPDGDLELRFFILRRQEEVQAYTYATKATGVSRIAWSTLQLVHPCTPV